MKAVQVDDRRRVVMPPECPAHSAVTIQQLDSDCWLIKRQNPDKEFKLVALRVIDRLADDPEWKKKEVRIARAANRHLPPFEE